MIRLDYYSITGVSYLYLYCVVEFAPGTDAGAIAGNVIGAKVPASGDLGRKIFARGILESAFLLLRITVTRPSLPISAPVLSIEFLPRLPGLVLRPSLPSMSTTKRRSCHRNID